MFYFIIFTPMKQDNSTYPNINNASKDGLNSNLNHDAHKGDGKHDDKKPQELRTSHSYKEETTSGGDMDKHNPGENARTPKNTEEMKKHVL